MACSEFERKTPVWLASVAFLAAGLMSAAASATDPVKPDSATERRPPFSMVFAPATAPGAPAFDPVPIAMPVRDWTPLEFAVLPPTQSRSAGAKQRTITVRLPDPPPSADTLPKDPATAAGPSPSPIDLAGRLLTWFGGLFDPTDDPPPQTPPTFATANADIEPTAPESGSDSTPSASTEAGWTAASIPPRNRSGRRADAHDVPNDIQFDLVGWLSQEKEPAENDVAAAAPVTVETAVVESVPEPDPETAAEPATERASAAADPAPGIVIARISDDPYGGAVIETPPPEPSASPVEKLAAVEPEAADQDGGRPLVIYIRGTVAFEDMYFGDGDRLGRKLAHAEPAVACAEKNGGGTHVCPETTAWPADVATLFGVAGDELPESIVRYDNRTASQYRAVFPAASYDHLVDKLSGRLGMPTRLSESLAPVLGMPKQTNRVARWVSTEQTDHGKAILEVRSIDDMLWNLPPDLGHGVVRLYFEDAEPIYATVSKADLRLARIRNMIAPGEEPL